MNERNWFYINLTLVVINIINFIVQIVTIDGNVGIGIFALSAGIFLLVVMIIERNNKEYWNELKNSFTKVLNWFKE